MKISSTLILLLLSMSNSAQTWQWAKKATGTASQNYGIAVAVDSAGNSFHTGYYTGNTVFGSTTITAYGGFDVFLSKYGKSGNLKWVTNAGGVYGDRGVGVAVDRHGNSYVVGTFSKTCQFQTIALSSYGSGSNYSDMFIAKYDSTGTIVWVKKGGSIIDDSVNGVWIDDAGNIFVSGGVSATAVFNTDTIQSGPYMIKYDSGGNIIWINKNYGHKLTGDNKGNLYSTGRFSGTLVIGSDTVVSAGSLDVYVAKYDTAGNSLWLKEFGGLGNDWVSAVSCDSSGNSYVAGYFDASLYFPQDTLVTIGDYDIYLVKFDSAGSFKWARRGGGQCEDMAFGLTTGKTGNSYLCGLYHCNSTFGTTTLTNPAFESMFVTLIDSAGNYTWAKSAIGSASTLNAQAIAIDSAENCFISGYFSNSATFNSVVLTTGNGYEIFAARLNTGPINTALLNTPDMEANLIVSPNPSSGRFNLNFSTAQLSKPRIEVITIYGEKILDLPFASTNSVIDLSNREAGIYFLQLTDQNNSISRKLCLTR